MCWCWFEMVFVVVLAVFGIALIGGSFVWVLFGWDWLQPIANRFVQVLGTLNKNWPVCLAITIPLVFRPLRIFLENLKKVGGAERFSKDQTEPTNEQPISPLPFHENLKKVGGAERFSKDQTEPTNEQPISPGA